MNYISGPVSYYELDYEGKTYTFFGDMHRGMDMDCNSFGIKCKTNDNDEDSNCWSFLYYLDKKLTHNNKNKITTDIFLEHSYIHKSIKIPKSFEVMGEKDLLNQLQDDYMTRVFKFLNSCFALDKTKCKYYPHVRVHYTDVRSVMMDNISYVIFPFRYLSTLYKLNRIDTFDSTAVMMMLHNWVYGLYDLLRISMEYKDITKDINKLKDLFIDDPVSNNLNFMWKLSLDLITTFLTRTRNKKRVHKIAIQLEALEKQGKHELVDKIKEFIITRADVYINLMEKYFHDMTTMIESNVIDDYLLFWESAFLKFDVITLLIDTCFMDAYLLGRIFRYEGKESIVYAGDEHVKRYVKFFDYYLNTTPICYQSRKLSYINRCLHTNQ